MKTYIKFFPNPLLDDIIKNRCVPIIGAGFSKNAVLNKEHSIPDWDQLGRALANYLTDYEYGGPVDALSYYEHEYSRPKLVEQLTEELSVGLARPGGAHMAFCSLPFDLCVTTNFDFLIEEGYSEVNRRFVPILDEDQLAVDTDLQAVKLIKLHGDLNHPSHMVVTESDYDSFLTERPLMSTFLANLLITRTPLFVGYSMNDPDFRQIWQLIGNRLGKLRRQAYTLAVSPTPTETARFERRGIKSVLIPGDKKNYRLVLEQVFKELREYWLSKTLANSSGPDPNTTMELTTVDRDNNRICLFVVPAARYLYYREIWFPIAEEFGFMPILASQIESPGDSIAAKISALIETARIIVADISSKATELELRQAMNKPIENILMLSSAPEIPSEFEQLISIMLPKSTLKDAPDFWDTVYRWFKDRSAVINDDIGNEPMRLFNKREYRAAIISAISLLEIKLRKALSEKHEFPETNRSRREPLTSLSNREMLRFLNQREAITGNQYERALSWLRTRNQSAHENKTISRKTAQELISGVLSLIKKI